MGTTDKLCCDCRHYRFGHLDDPCEKGKRRCGYLHEGCELWKKAREKSEETPVEFRPLQAKYGKLRRAWTEEENNILREMYPTHSIRMLEVKLNRSRASICQRALKMGLKR